MMVSETWELRSVIDGVVFSCKSEYYSHHNRLYSCVLRCGEYIFKRFYLSDIALADGSGQVIVTDAFWRFACLMDEYEENIIYSD